MKAFRELETITTSKNEYKFKMAIGRDSTNAMVGMVNCKDLRFGVEVGVKLDVEDLRRIRLLIDDYIIRGA